MNLPETGVKKTLSIWDWLIITVPTFYLLSLLYKRLVLASLDSRIPLKRFLRRLRLRVSDTGLEDLLPKRDRSSSQEDNKAS